MILPATSVVTVVTSTRPSPSVNKSAAVNTTGKAAPVFVKVLVTVPLTPTKVTVELEPASLSTVIAPVAAVASAAVLMRSPSSSTVTLGATVSIVKSVVTDVALL